MTAFSFNTNIQSLPEIFGNGRNLFRRPFSSFQWTTWQNRGVEIERVDVQTSVVQKPERLVSLHSSVFAASWVGAQSSWKVKSMSSAFSLIERITVSPKRMDFLSPVTLHVDHPVIADVLQVSLLVQQHSLAGLPLASYIASRQVPRGGPSQCEKS
ncbi:hypothetical protein Y032_0060g3097 [Ancylostoma ceylanicum]|uniref:Uncharacterized protein n=1 Tax=Ancylostoma ceylanicum TaxID=53326 RepID=A0A016U2Q5_9BILA|nr:hypothetical protein Y032_0060g3097 [Ancylostoma ceylanicum]